MMTSTTTTILLWLAVAATVTHSSVATVDNRPVIGVLGVPATDGSCDTLYAVTNPATGNGKFDTIAAQVSASGAASCFATVYVKWLEMAGARVAPIGFDLEPEALEDLFNSLNGVLFTGGGLSLGFETQYFQTAQHLYDLVLAANDKGEHVPLWGTCMGFQLLNIITAHNQSVLDRGAFNSEDLPLALDFSADARSSRMFANAPEQVFKDLGSLPITANLHHDGVPPSVFTTNPKLVDFYGTPISTNAGRDGKRFVSTMEGLKYPVYATQWHPERPQFEWTVSLNLNHSAPAIEAMQYMGNFFVSEARKNSHSFPTPAALAKALIYNYKPIGDTSYQMYVF